MAVADARTRSDAKLFKFDWLLFQNKVTRENAFWQINPCFILCDNKILSVNCCETFVSLSYYFETSVKVENESTYLPEWQNMQASHVVSLYFFFKQPNDFFKVQFKELISMQVTWAVVYSET